MEWLIVLGSIALLWGIITYNRFVSHRHHVLEAWSGIDVQLKRRHSLIPSLVEVVKAYSQYERETLSAVTVMRNRVEQVGSTGECAAMESELSHAIGRLLALAEAYPELKANESFLNLQHNLSEVEDQIQYARRYYNGTVRNLNVLVQSFPSNLIARLFTFHEAEYFEIELAIARESPEMKF